MLQFSLISRPKGRHPDLSYPDTSLAIKRTSSYDSFARNPNSTNNLALPTGCYITSVLRQKLFFERAKIYIISHINKHLHYFSLHFSQCGGKRSILDVCEHFHYEQGTERVVQYLQWYEISLMAKNPKCAAISVRCDVAESGAYSAYVSISVASKVQKERCNTSNGRESA